MVPRRIRIAANITATVLAAVGMWEAAGYVFLGSVILWAFMYLWIAEEWHTLVTDEDTDDIEATFFAVHVGALNFLLDVPGIESKHARGAHYIIVLSNVVAAIALTIGLSVSEPLDAAWGCYPPDAPLSAGMCASAFQVCPPVLGRLCFAPDRVPSIFIRSATPRSSARGWTRRRASSRTRSGTAGSTRSAARFARPSGRSAAWGCRRFF